VLVHTATEETGASLRPVLDFRETEIPGVVVVEAEPAVDERGWFSRAYCRREFAQHDIDFVPVQISFSANARRGTLRGLHFQAPPQPEAKLVCCTRGSAFDVALDLRPGSTSYGRWSAAELAATVRNALYIPPGCAHGFQTLEDDTELLYLISEFFDPSLQRGVRWDDPALDIAWPAEPTVISKRDRSFPDFTW
jgi:dTDP-4-dehydrorhamnose 3,5-epimerase